jgi:hypothetical protein
MDGAVMLTQAIHGLFIAQLEHKKVKIDIRAPASNAK